jgi:hypothetical protein
MSDTIDRLPRVARNRIPGAPTGKGGLRANEFDPFFMFNRLWGFFWGKRDYYKVFGWDPVITPQMIYRMYQRGGIAKRIIEAYPKETWSEPPELPTVSAKFDKTWAAIVLALDLWSEFYKWDKLSRMGRYGVLLVGNGDANLETEMTTMPATGPVYIQPYSEMSAQITQWQTDAQDPRFGQPLQYTIYPDLLEAQTRPPMMTSWGFPTRRSFKCHASRILHAAQGPLEDNIFGTPMFVPIWNYLTDLQKVVGGSAESYWLTANRGLQLDIDKDMSLDPEEEASLDQEVEEYGDQQRRVLRTRGITAKDLGAKVADPRGPYSVILQLLSGSTGIPTRIMIGSEAGHLASTQDKSAWSQEVEAYRALTAGPKFLIPFIQLLVKCKVLPDPKDKLEPLWPDAYRASPLERAQTVNQLSTGIMNIALAMSKIENLLSIEEARRIIGTPSDNKIFEAQSEDVPTSGTKAKLQPPPAIPGGGGAGKGTTPGAGNEATPGSSDSSGAAGPGSSTTSPASGSGA